MDTTTLLRKLEPLIPESVRRWRRILPTLDQHVKALLQRQIASAAQRLLGDIDNRLLLPPPSRQAARGEFHLGTVIYDKEKWPFGLNRGELLQGLGIYGRSGAGKSNLVWHLLLQLDSKRIPVLFLDWKRTARHLIPRLKNPTTIYTPGRNLSPLPFNPLLSPPGLEPEVYADLLLDVLAEAYTLGDGAISLLQQAIRQCQHSSTTLTVDSVTNRLASITTTGRSHGWKASATRALQSVAFSRVSSGTSSDQESFAASLLERTTIIELDALTQSAKRFLIPLLCLWVYYVMLASRLREHLRLVIVIEEAHHVLHRGARARETVMEMLLRQCRELGIAIVVVDQHPSLISQAALGNCYASVILNTKAPSDIAKAAALSSLDEGDRQYLSKLPVGQAVIKLQNRWHHPFMVRTPLINIDKGAVTDDALQAHLRGLRRLSGRRPRYRHQKGTLGDSRSADTGPDNDAFVLFLDVVHHPSDGVDARYKRLRWSADKGQRLKTQLVRLGLLKAEAVATGTTRRVLLRPTARANRELGLPMATSRESLAHEYWKHAHAQRYRAIGYDVRVEAPRSNSSGRVDVLATKGRESVAIEVETGKSDVVANVKRDLLAGYGSILVAATDGNALRTIEQQLARSGLLGTGRVRLVLCHKLILPGDVISAAA